MTTRAMWIVLAALLAAPRGAAAQAPLPPIPSRSFELGPLQQAAVDTDPRMQQLQLLLAQSELRLRNIGAQRLPTLVVDGQAQYQSDVAHLESVIPGVDALILPPKDTFDTGVNVEQRLLDPSLAAQSALERAQLAENQARVRSTLFALRQQVNDAFFTAAGLEARAGALEATIADLNTRLTETNARVREGTALPAESAAIEATLLQRQQDADDLWSSRRAALDRLETLTGQSVANTDSLRLPDLAAAVARARQSAVPLRARPEFDQFARTRDRIARQQELTTAQERPRLSAYGRVGYGQPGLNFIQSAFQAYGLGGVRLQWNAWTWDTGTREREALRIQQRVVETDEAAFAKQLVTTTHSDEAAIDRLERALATDERIVTLREQVERSAQIRLQEGVVTASEYLDRNTELLQARFARAGHEVELAQASARFLTTLGLEVR
ncbi:MAG TPA: TolC family protein [Vicinamibacterales bacterium]|nr:TolC family protein [Vicinamibacterales bacterium]